MNVDIYSFGAVGLEVLLRKRPRDSPKYKLDYLRNLGEAHPFHPVLRECLDDDPDARPDSEAPLSHLQELPTSLGTDSDTDAALANGTFRVHKVCFRSSVSVTTAKQNIARLRACNRKAIG